MDGNPREGNSVTETELHINQDFKCNSYLSWKEEFEKNQVPITIFKIGKEYGYGYLH